MYDSYPKVFSVGISYKNKPKPRPRQQRQRQQSSGTLDNGLMKALGGLLGMTAIAVGKATVNQYEKIKYGGDLPNYSPEEKERESRYQTCLAGCVGLSDDGIFSSEKEECRKHCRYGRNP